MAASAVAQYLDALPEDRCAALSAVRKAINQNLPDGYEEGMQFGMIGWYVPLSMYPAGYGENPKVPQFPKPGRRLPETDSVRAALGTASQPPAVKFAPCEPLPLVALASQKSGMVLHFLCFYGHPTLSTWFISEWSDWERATWTEKPRGSGERVGGRTNQYKKSGKKLDMGKGCVRFKSLEDLALDVVGRTVARVPVEEHIANYRAARALLRKAVTRVKERPGFPKAAQKRAPAGRR